MKTDLVLRPIYHKRDDAAIAHLNLGLLAYWIVNTIRFQLKRGEYSNSVEEVIDVGNHKNKGSTLPHDQCMAPITKETLINFCWKEIVRMMNTQKAVTTTAQNNYEEVILIRRCSEPNEKVQAIYDKLKYKSQAFTKRKFVVHKSELKKMEYMIYQGIMT